MHRLAGAYSFLSGGAGSFYAAAAHSGLVLTLLPAVIGAIGAIVAAVIGRGTLREVRRVRQEQRRPQLILTRIDHGSEHGWFITDTELSELEPDDPAKSDG